MAFQYITGPEAATLSKAYRLLQAKDFNNFRLTSEFASDASSNRGMVDFSTAEWRKGSSNR